MPKPQQKWGIGPICDFIEAHGLQKRFADLGDDMLAEVRYGAKRFKFFVPDAMTDKMQLFPLMTGRFHEEALLRVFAKHVRPGGVLCDLGANYGNHTVFFASVMNSRHVHAFEPQKHLVNVINTTLEANAISNVSLHAAAAGAKTGYAHLHASDGENSGMASFKPGAGHEPVEMISGDDVVGDADVTGIKIDVEGMQMPALRGLSKTIRKNRPVLWLELRPAKNEIEQPSTWLREKFGYRRERISFRDFLFLPEE